MVGRYGKTCLTKCGDKIMMKLKNLLKEEQEKKWIIRKKDVDNPYGFHEMVGVVSAMSSDDAMEKFYAHEKIEDYHQNDYFPSEAKPTDLDKYKKYWEGKLTLAKKQLISNMNIQ